MLRSTPTKRESPVIFYRVFSFFLFGRTCTVRIAISSMIVLSQKVRKLPVINLEAGSLTVVVRFDSPGLLFKSQTKPQNHV